jgi:hypothetical protein
MLVIRWHCFSEMSLAFALVEGGEETSHRLVTTFASTTLAFITLAFNRILWQHSRQRRFEGFSLRSLLC